MQSGEAGLLYVHLGAKIAEARARKGWSQSVLAKRARLTRGSIANIEIGRQRAPLETIWRIGDALGIEPRILIPSMSELLTSSDSVEAGQLPARVEKYLAQLSGGDAKVKALIRDATAELGEVSDEATKAASKKKTSGD